MGEKLTVLAAGSLRDVMNELGASFHRQTGTEISPSFGLSGKLRAEIEAGRPIDVFASASVEHTSVLAGKQLLARSIVFAYNDLCVVTCPKLGVTEANMLEVLSKPEVRVATSTPVSDPVGDYTWQFFRNADKQRPGFYEAMNTKALKLSGATVPSPSERSPYIAAFQDDRADVYLMYCTNAATAKAALPPLAVLRIPEALNVRSAYGIGEQATSASGSKFVEFVLSPAGMEIPRRHGFNPAK
ncbi:molybdate ABC transporter substrate-binding protein [Cupriavidus respiraculi]|uniref:Molybdate-binding protein ModA n=2 Tax=Cupriavidus respiraculi TaxID=195930 RepID=A0ABM8WVU6_9BURK|nr:Molybdate-binding protein ModA [Cupriavidus respiraculi]